MDIENLDDFLPIMDEEISKTLLDDEPIIGQTNSKEDSDLPDEEEEEFEQDDNEELFDLDEEEEDVSELPLNEVKSAQATAEVLKQLGLILPDSEINSYDDVEDLLKTQAPQAIVNAMVDDLPDFGKNLAVFVLNKGSELTKEDLKDFYNDFFQDELVSTMSFSEDNIEDAKSFLRTEFKNKGMRESVINKTLDALEIEDELLDEANNILTEKKKTLRTTEKAEISTQTSQQKRDEEVAFIKSIRQEIVGTGWKKERQEKVLDVIANNKVSEVIRDAFSDPKSYVEFANLLSYYDFKTKSFDLTDFLNKAATKEVEKQKSSIFRDAYTSKGSGGASEDTPKPGSRNKLSGLKPIL
jgi:hypothetical protein